MVDDVIPYRRMKRVLKQYIKGEVTHDSIICVRDALLGICKSIATDVIREFEEHNRLRQFHGLPKLKRIPTNLYIKVLQEHLSSPTRFNISELGQDNIDTSLQDANEVV